MWFYVPVNNNGHVKTVSTVLILSFRTAMPGQTVQTQIRSSLILVCTVCNSLCIVWTHYSMVESQCSNFRVITTIFWGIRIFRKFTVTETHCSCISFRQCRKFPKYSDKQKIYCNHPKSLTRWRFLRVMHPKDAEGTANSVDPDQTAPLGLHCLPRPVCPKT